MPFLKAQVSFPLNVASVFCVIKHNSSILFLAQTLYTVVKSSPLKCKFLRFSTAWAKIHQVPHVNFELASQFSNFASFFIVMTQNASVNFKLTHFLLWIKESNESHNFENFVCSGMKICQILHVMFQTTSQFFFKFCITLYLWT